MTDARFMRMALALAAAQLGRTAPNPAVGCVIVRGDRVVGHGATGDGGRPHAEERALAMAGSAAQGATAFVTLEPCFQRSTGAASCSERLIAAGIARVVAAVADPHPNAAGAGLKRLEAAGLMVSLGDCASEAHAQHAGFFRVVREGLAHAAIDARAWLYDGPLRLDDGDDVREALRVAARNGLTRLYAPPGSPAADALAASGL